jgi:hypothetical protein
MSGNRFDLLSQSDSGLRYVRERKGGLMRVLTASELEDFNDPPPCPQCSEQFGCEHINCAGEALLSDAEVETEVTPAWTAFAREVGLSRQDLTRLTSIEKGEEGFRAVPGASTDMRLLELVLLLNE